MADAPNPLEWHERATIGGALNLDEGQPPVEILALEPEHFEDRRHSIIWTAVCELLGGGHPVDQITIAAKLAEHGHKGLLALIAELAFTHCTNVNLGYHARQVWDAGQHRILRSRIDDVVERSDGDSFDEVKSGVLDAVKSIERLSDGRGLVHVREPLRKALSALADQYENPDADLMGKTGLKDLDHLIRMKSGELSVIAARPSIGKSALAASIARDCARDPSRKVCLFSLEMDALSLIIRLLQREAKTTAERLPELAHIGELIHPAERIGQANIYIDDRAAVSVDDIRAALKTISNPALVIVDYIQIAKLDQKLERQDIRIGAVTSGLKALAKEFACHVMALSQLSREAERGDGRPKLSHLRDSGAIEQDADIVLMLHRPDDTVTAPTEIIVRKNRNGPTGTVSVAWFPEFQTFADLARG
jgi:replicative DNA helicase